MGILLSWERNFYMERLQKVLAHAGIASRRKCEELILGGRVSVDGEVVTELGSKVDVSAQRITVDGQQIEVEQKICIMVHKPTSRITSVSDPEGRKTVMDAVADIEQRVYPVGRLDYDTSGLLLMTNDGELTHRLLHPSYHLDKVYRATVLGLVDKQTIRKLEEGILLEDGKTAPAKVYVLRQHPRESVVELTIHEGRNRQVRRMFEALDMPVKRLRRIQFGPLILDKLGIGTYRYLTRQEWDALYRAVGLVPPEYLGATGSPQVPDEAEKWKKGKRRGKQNRQSTRMKQEFRPKKRHR
jgi:23S rRNA pseudouridine2605 synthase